MTDTDFVTATRTFYDAIAEDYAERFRDEIPGKPLDRAVFAAFAALVGEGEPVADLGCGPGRVTAHLASLGLSVFGLDLSESMLAIARRENPGLRFEQGSMLELALPDGSLGARCPGTPPSTPLWRNSPPSSPSSGGSWPPAAICSSPSRSATSPAATRSPGGTR
ncbi:SAM-dependent methyltransferase [Streptomyces sp. SAI-149]|nr:SAM-dependent methyltransferase [Streptomyces sp. SAI-119]MDH6497349.1 SAM-dependent methyltransferase [Streptomyces sp. SAI-149]